MWRVKQIVRGRDGNETEVPFARKTDELGVVRAVATILSESDPLWYTTTAIYVERVPDEVASE